MIQKRSYPAKGSRGLRDGLNVKRIAVSFPDEMFDKIRELAVIGGTSFSEQVRLFCQWGLDTEREIKNGDQTGN
jgi:hypothetical protein